MKKRHFFVLAFLLFCVAATAADAQKKVDLYLTSWCPYCRKLESFLKNHHIDYTRHDVEADGASANEFERLGGEGIPLTRVGDKVIRGYDPDGIVKALKK